MKCPNCGCEMTVDHVVNGTVVFVCTNRTCEKYLKGTTDNGDKAEVLMRDTEEEARADQSIDNI